MHNFSFKKLFSVAKTEYIKWVLNPRIIMLFVLFIFVKTCAIDPLTEHASEMENPLNILEPFIAVGNSGLLVLILPVVYLTLISDFPKLDGNTLFFITRIGKLNWLLGQITFAIMSLFTFMGIVFLSCTIPVFRNSFWGNNWSYVVTRYDSVFPDKAGGFASRLIPPNLYNQISPFSAIIQTFILLCCYLFILTLIMLLYTILKHKIIGFFTSGSLIAFGVATCSSKASLMWFFPMANAIIWLHYKEYFKEPIKAIKYSYIYFAIIIVILIFLNIICLRKFSFETVQEVD